jgi:hypothetical protein
VVFVRTIIVLAAAGLMACAGCASGGTTPASPERNVRLTARLGDHERTLSVRTGTHISVAFPHNPTGRWARPTVAGRTIVTVTTRDTPPGITVEIDAKRAGTTTVRVRTTPHGDLSRPGSVHYAQWSLRLTVTS